jgi:hypothetical protein
MPRFVIYSSHRRARRFHSTLASHDVKLSELLWEGMQASSSSMAARIHSWASLRSLTRCAAILRPTRLGLQFEQNGKNDRNEGQAVFGPTPMISALARPRALRSPVVTRCRICLLFRMMQAAC